MPLMKNVAPEVKLYSVKYGDETIHFSVRRQPERKVDRVAIHVESDGRVMVDAPEHASATLILAAVKQRSRWISLHLSEARARLVHVLPREYVSGESLAYLGRRYRLKVLLRDGERPQARMHGAYIDVFVSTHTPELVRAALDAWYRRRAREVFGDRLAAVAAPLRWVRHVPPMRLQSMKAQWGSCSPAGRITLNPHLVKAPRECIDYVLLHELCHLLHHNHSPRFYAELDCHMPGWRAVKERLDDMAEQLLGM